MDHQNRVGSKPGGGGVASSSETNIDRRERLRKLALETIDLSKDPYFMKNHLGSYECKLCLTLHTNEGSYLAHTQGKKHQTNLARRAAIDAKENGSIIPLPLTTPQVQVRKNVLKIGRPGYKVTKLQNGSKSNKQFGFLFQVHYPEIGLEIVPRYRFMSAFEQKVEPPNKAFQYLLIAAEPYETVAFKVQSKEVDKDESLMFAVWDRDSSTYTLQFFFKKEDPYSK